MTTFLALSGSLRAASTNTALLKTMQLHAPDDCRIILYDRLGHLPIFNPDDEGARTPKEATALIDAVTEAYGVIISCPEYAHGVPGGLKNALDWLVSRDVAVGKPAILVHASPRSLISRVALAEILRTMSFDLFEEATLEIRLLGKTPAETEAILAEPASISAINECLTQFARLAKPNN